MWSRLCVEAIRAGCCPRWPPESFDTDAGQGGDDRKELYRVSWLGVFQRGEHAEPRHDERDDEHEPDLRLWMTRELIRAGPAGNGPRRDEHRKQRQPDLLLGLGIPRGDGEQISGEGIEVGVRVEPQGERALQRKDGVIAERVRRDPLARE